MTADQSPREHRREQRLELSRTQVLDAAEYVFARKGFHDATIKEIATRAEFSVGAVYGFFESKDDLFAQIYQRRGSEFMAGMREVLDDHGSARERMHRLATFQVEFFRDHADFGRLFLRSSGVPLNDGGTPVDRAVTDNYTEAMNLEAKLFREGQDHGELRHGDPDVLALLFSGLVSAYQSIDPVVVAGAPPGTERMALADLHDILDGAFTVA